MTYIWATLVIIELLVAAMAGDFSEFGLNRYRTSMGSSSHDDILPYDSDGDAVAHDQRFPEAVLDEEMAVGAGVGRVDPAQNPLTRSSALGQDDGRLSQRERYRTHQ